MFQPVINPFSKYADKTEKKVDKLLKSTAVKSRFDIQRKLLELMQQNLVAVNLWLERRFKGYKYLSKGKRKDFYQNTAIIVDKFKKFQESLQIDEQHLKSLLSYHNFQPLNPDQEERIKYIYAIMTFLKPGKHYQYLEGASFGKLLSDISKHKMIGDCNQIVTFYTFLYTQKYDIKDLKIKLLPKHVCLHYEGIDIEATNGTFHHYKEYEKLLPALEIITTNLLDTCDVNDKQLQIDARSYIKAAELAHRISGSTEIIDKNLKVAYHNLAIEASRSKDFETAKFFINKLNDPKLKENIFQNAVMYYTKKKDFKKALYYASSLNKPELRKYVLSQQGWSYFKKHNYSRAIKIFQNVPDPKMVKACYGQMYNRVQKKVANIKTEAGHKAHKADYRKMIDLAGKMGDHNLEAELRKFLNSLP